jgi:tetratricopeptide (TPR) repeat protein
MSGLAMAVMGRHFITLAVATACATPPVAPPAAPPRPPAAAIARPPPAHTQAEGAQASALGRRLVATGDLKQAIPHLEKAYAIAKELLPRSLTAGIVTAELASALFDDGAPELAAPYFAEAVGTLESVLPLSDPNLALLIAQQVQCLLALDRSSDAARTLKALLGRARGADVVLPTVVIALAQDTARSFAERGDFASAALLYEESIPAVGSIQGTDAARHRFLALSDLARAYELAGAPGDELAVLNQMTSLEVGDADQRCRLSMRVAVAAFKAGRLREGQEAVEEAWSCLKSEDAGFVAWVSFQLSRLGRGGAAQLIIDRALKDKKRFDAAGQASLHHALVIAALVDNDACAAQAAGARQVALLQGKKDLADRLTAAREQLKESRRQCAGLPPLGGTKKDENPQAAVERAREDLESIEQHQAPESPSVYARRFNLGSALLKAGDKVAACDELGKAGKAFTGRSLGTANELARATHLAQQQAWTPHIIDALVTACLGSPEQLAEHLLMAKGHMLEGVRQEAQLTALGTTPDKRELVLRLRSVRAAIAGVVLLPGAAAQLAELTRRKEELERRLAAATNGGARFLEPFGVIGGAVGLRKSLLADEAYVDFTVYRPVFAAGRVRHLLALVLTRDSVAAHDLGPLTVVAARRDAWLSEIANWSSTGELAVARLRAKLVEPALKTLPKATRHLIVTIDGELDGVPWHHPALTGSPGRPMSVWLVPSARELVRYKLAADSTVPIAGRMVAVHRADFDSGGGTLLPSASRLFVLPPESAVASLPGAQLDDLTGVKASRANVIAALPRATVLHIQSHGVALDQEAKSVLRRNPFSSVALALAGANVIDARGRRLGVVTAEELIGLAGPGLRIATLAMCDGAKGAAIPGQGNLGFAAALSANGTPAVIASAWRASFESAEVLFPDFYERLGGGIGLRPAFDAALEQVRGKAPLTGARHWAGWLFLGYTRESHSPTLELSRLVLRLCSCRTAECGWKDRQPMEELKQILAAPNLTSDEEETIVGLLGSLKQCQPDEAAGDDEAHEVPPVDDGSQPSRGPP